jgi:hypothetical protein
MPRERRHPSLLTEKKEAEFTYIRVLYNKKENPYTGFFLGWI